MTKDYLREYCKNRNHDWRAKSAIAVVVLFCGFIEYYLIMVFDWLVR